MPARNRGDQTTVGAPLHVALCEPPPDPKARAGIAGQSVRFGGKLYDFEAFIELYGAAFTERFVESFTRLYIHATPSTTEKRASNLKRILIYLARRAILDPPDTALARVYRKLRDGEQESISKRDMADAVEVVVGALRDPTDMSFVSTSNELTRQNIIESASPMLQDLAQEGLWPNVGPLKGILGSRESRGHNIPTLGELENISGRRNVTKSDVHQLNGERLKRLREVLEQQLLLEEQAFDLRSQMMQQCELSIELITAAVDDILRLGPTKGWQTTAAKKCFPISDPVRCRVSLARYFANSVDGTFRLTHQDSWIRPLVHHCGGTVRIQEYLEPSSRAMLAAFCLVLIDTGMNVQPCDDLAADPFIGQARYGKVSLKTIGVTKNRSNYKSVSVDVVGNEALSADLQNEFQAAVVVPQSKLSTVRAIQIWQKISKQTRDIAHRNGQKEANYLWIVRNGSTKEIARYKHSSWKDWWATFLASIRNDEIIGGLPMQRKMIRPTVLQLRAVHMDTDSVLVSKIANHGSPNVTNRHYLNRAHIYEILDKKIRHFQNLFEAIVVSDDAIAVQGIGLEDSVFRSRRAEAVATGLGFACQDPGAGVQPGTEGQTCDRLDACATCPLMRFAPTEESLLGLILFKRGLEAAQDEFAARNPDRWVRVWLPGLALCSAIEMRLQSGPKRRLLQDAVECADRKIAGGEAVPFRPW